MKEEPLDISIVRGPQTQNKKHRSLLIQQCEDLEFMFSPNTLRKVSAAWL